MQPTDPSIPSPPGVSAVIVNYESWPDVVRLVDSLKADLPDRAEIIVVDNASPGPVPAALLGPIPGVRLVVRPENGGFSAGVNAGWRAASHRWLLVLNPDIVPEPGFLARVAWRVEGYESRPIGPPGVVGFGLRNPDGSRQPSVGSFPGLVRTAWEQLIPRDRRKYQPGWRLKAGPVDWVTGACMLVDSRLMDDLGGMDEDFFLYHEEVALCHSARSLGRSVEYDPSVAVVHLRPLQNRPISPKMRVITRHGKLLYFRKHLPPWQFAALRRIVRIEAWARGAWARRRGRKAEARSWKAVGRVALLMGSGAGIRGTAVLALAETVEEPTEDDGEGPSLGRKPARKASPRGSHRKRPIPPRKDGPA